MSERVMLGADERFCSSCGSVIKKDAEICVKCGVRQSGSSKKSRTTALLLCFFLGGLGAHRFYTGSIGIGVVQLLTVGLCGIWTLIDFIMLLAGSYKDSDSNRLK